MTGRVLSEEEIQVISETWDLSTATREEYGESIIITNLIATIRDRDKTINDWQHECNELATHNSAQEFALHNLQQVNNIMRETLERIVKSESSIDLEFRGVEFRKFALDALAKVKGDE